MSRPSDPAPAAGATRPHGALLDSRPEEASRRIALGFLADAEIARRRLDDAADTEALHDYRVALRRLRSTLRAFRETLADVVPKKLRRRLSRLAGATGAARDAEVQLAWIASRRAAARGPERRALRWLGDRLAAREEAARAAALREVARRHAAVDRALRRRLQSLRIDLDVTAVAPPDLAGWLARRALAQGEELAAALGAVGDRRDVEPAHEARIAAKRLRYLLEPVREEEPLAGALVDRLKRLQDTLGDLHDAHVLVRTLADELAAAAAERTRRRVLALEEAAGTAGAAPPPVGSVAPGGVTPLVGTLRATQEARFETFARAWLGGAAASFFDDLATLAGALEARTARG